MSIIKKLMFKYEQYTIKKYWRKKNPHNLTNITYVANENALRFIKSSKIKVGKNSYGLLNIHISGNKYEELIIGSNCSISGHSHFLLGGEHKISSITMFPYNELMFEGECESLTKGPIIIDDEVWIGCEALILSGVHIGKGAIIGAGSVVRKDVPPYAIVSGNPAQVIRYRFDKEIIEKIKDIDLSKINLSKSDLKYLYMDITHKNVDEICNNFLDRN